MKILIIGGGIGGLTTALCCLRRGHDVTVFEQASTLAPVGAGLQIPPNAMKVFAALDIDTAIAETAFSPPALEMRMGKSGTSLLKVDLDRQAITAWGAPYYHMHRADCIYALETAINREAPDTIRLDAKVTGYEQNDCGVEIILANGQAWRGDVLIGADGIHSLTRTQMFGPDKAVFTGNTAWRTVIPLSQLGNHAPDPSVCVWTGQGKHAVTYRVRCGTLANFVGVVEQRDWHLESWHAQGSRDDALADFSGWHPSIIRILEQSTVLFRWALFDRPPLPVWNHNRVALLGDAAHPMLPFMAQGAAMAIEDAWIVAAELSMHNRDVASSLQAYHRRRHQRATRVQAQSRTNMKLFHQGTASGQFMHYGPIWLAGRLAPGIVRKRLSWLYGHDVTA